MPLKYHKFIFPLLIVLLGLIICLINYTPGTYLTGWDTLHPEFDYLLNLKRTIVGVFRVEQGLGAVAAHAHMVEIPRILMLALFDIFLPNTFIRYFYIIFTLILGPLGMFYFLKYSLKKEFSKFKYIGFSAFLGAIFYMLNLGTLQQFVVPFEMFNALYGFLPWIFLFALKYIHTSNTEQKKYLLLFALFSLLASPMAYAPALWYMHFMMLGLFLLVLSVPKLIKKDFKVLRKPTVLIVTTLLVNAYWFMPHLYFLANNSSQIQDALINKLFSEQAFYYNKSYGGIRDLALLKSFLFSWAIFIPGSGYTDLLKPWLEHIQQIWVLAVGYIFFFVSVAGLIYSIIKRKIIFISLSVVLFLSLFFLFNENPPLGFIFTLIRENVPLFKEALRFPHTKLFIHYIFLFSIFFSTGLLLLSNTLKRFNKNIPYIGLVIFIILIFLFMLPAFRGYYISPQMRLDIPNEYFELSDYLNTKDEDGKLALLPINSFWGWDYHDWGYQGAGFNWFNIKQPVLHRNFDRWASPNEQFYKEMSTAVYSQDVERFENVIDKYNITYLLVDKSIIAPENNPNTLFYEETDDLLQKQKVLEMTKAFGHLELYENKNPKSLINSIENPTSIEPAASILDEDKAYKKYGNYVSNLGSKYTYLPFRDLIDNESEIKKDLYKLTENGISFPINSSNTIDIDPSDNELIYADVLIRNNSISTSSILVTPINSSDSYKSASIEIPVRNVNGGVININENYTFNMPIVESGATLLLGRVLLESTKDNKISVYDKDSARPQPIPFTNDNFLLSQCDDTTNIDSFGISFLSGNSFSIFGNKIPLCLIVPLSNIIESNNSTETLAINTRYNSNINNTNAPSYVCLINLINGNCISYFSTDFSSKNVTDFSYGVNQQDIQDVGLKFFIDATKNETPTEVEFNNFTISTTSPYSTYVIPGEQIKNMTPPQENISEYVINYSGDPRLSQDISNLPKSSGKCGHDPRFAIDEKKKSIEIMSDFIRYTTDNGSLCDSFSYQNLIPNQGYIVLVTSRNVTGLPLSMCLTNFYSKRCDIYASLTDNKEFTTQAFLLPPMGDKTNGYDLNTNNIAIRGTTSINDLKSIVFIPIPYDSITDLSSSEQVDTSQIKNMGYSKLNNSLYRTDVPNLNQFLNLAYTNDIGWKAYVYDKENVYLNDINYFLPFLFGEELENKVTVNNWSNGWEIDKPGSYILIVYLPQYFEYIGIFLTLETIIILAIFYFASRKKRRDN